MDYLPAWPLSITPFIAFGLLLIMGAIGGYIAHKSPWLPSITGFMIVGFIFGPSGFGLLSHAAMDEARVLIHIALALILYRLGLSLDLKAIAHSPRLLFTSLLESALTFGSVFFVLHLFDVPNTIAALVAAITISSSPAVLLHVAHEVGAKGEVTDSSKTLVALNNLISFIAFSAALPFLFLSTGADWGTTLLQPLYQFVGSLLLGLLLGHGLHLVALKTHEAAQYKLALVIGTIMIALGLATSLKLSTLLAPLVIGIVVRSLERQTVVSSLEFGSSFELFFIVLFVFAGAALHLHELIEFAPAVLMLVLVRSFAKVFGVTTVSAIAKRPFRVGASSGLLLIPMAGLAIGLVQTSGSLFPQYAPTIAAIVLGAVTVFETIGPPLAVFAFRFARESANTNAHAGHTFKKDPPLAP